MLGEEAIGEGISAADGEQNRLESEGGGELDLEGDVEEAVANDDSGLGAGEMEIAFVGDDLGDVFAFQMVLPDSGDAVSVHPRHHRARSHHLPVAGERDSDPSVIVPP